VKCQNKVTIQYLVQWTNQSEGQATWVFVDVLRRGILSSSKMISLEDKALKGGSFDTT